MHSFYLFSVWLHILAVAVWLGGMVFLALVVVPIIHRPEYRTLATPLMSQAGRQFRWVGWICLIILIVTGIINLAFRGFHWEDVGNGRLFSGLFGHILSMKLILVAIILGISVVHDFSLGPRATAVGQTAPGSPEALRLRRQASWIGRLNLLLALLVVLLGIRLVRG